MKARIASPRTIDDYIAAFPGDVQAVLRQIRDTIRKAAPGATEAIKYGTATFILDENLVHFAAFKKHIGFYPAPSAISAFSREIARYKSAKGSVQFPLDEPVPLKLIAKMVRFRVREVQERTGRKPART